MCNPSQEILLILLILLTALVEKQREISQLKERIEEMERSLYWDELRENFRYEFEEKDSPPDMLKSKGDVLPLPRE